MALSATIYKAALQITDMDRHYYQDHALTIARHPSETDERMMVRVLAFARHASEHLSFGKGRVGASNEMPQPTEPDLWQKDLTGTIELWIEVGQPDEKSVRQACGRAKQVVIYTYGGHKANRWWKQNRAGFDRAKNLTVISLPVETTHGLANLACRGMQLYCTIQDGQMMLGDGQETVEVTLTTLKEAEAPVR
jgi:uncharacterized protein YaeQ